MLAIVVLVLPTESFATQYKMQMFMVYHEQHPKNIADEVKNWVQSPYVQAGAAYFGIDPETIAKASTLASHIRTQGEEHYFKLDLPPGYSLCKLNAVMHSASKGGGSIGYWTEGADLAHVTVGIWLKKGGMFNGRNWVQNEVTLLSVPTSHITQYQSNGHCERRPIGAANRVDWYSSFF